MKELEQPVTACLIIIGNEILSGRTVDANLPYIARKLGEIGDPDEGGAGGGRRRGRDRRGGQCLSGAVFLCLYDRGDRADP